MKYWNTTYYVRSPPSEAGKPFERVEDSEVPKRLSWVPDNFLWYGTVKRRYEKPSASGHAYCNSSLMTVFSHGRNSLVCLSFLRNRGLPSIFNFYVRAFSGDNRFNGVYVCFPFFHSSDRLTRMVIHSATTFCQFNGFSLVPYWSQVSTCSLGLASVNRYFCVLKPNKYRLFFTRRPWLHQAVAFAYR